MRRRGTGPPRPACPTAARERRAARRSRRGERRGHSNHTTGRSPKSRCGGTSPGVPYFRFQTSWPSRAGSARSFRKSENDGERRLEVRTNHNKQTKKRGGRRSVHEEGARVGLVPVGLTRGPRGRRRAPTEPSAASVGRCGPRSLHHLGPRALPCPLRWIHVRSSPQDEGPIRQNLRQKGGGPKNRTQKKTRGLHQDNENDVPVMI